jgi:hypothetical protein
MLKNPANVKKNIFLFFVFISSLIFAQHKNDSTAIRLTIEDYLQGWNMGDSVRMNKALHRSLVKKIFQPESTGKYIVGENTKETMVQKTASKKKNPYNPDYYSIKILDMYNNMATARTETKSFVDYLHLAKIGDEWKIINVLWNYTLNQE